MKHFLLIGIFLMIATTTQAASKKWLLEKVDDIAVTRSYLDDFNTLSTDEKILLYYLSRAAIAGRDIYIDQRHKDALKIRQTMERLAYEEKSTTPAFKKKLVHYLKMLWINNGNYQGRTGVKMLPPFTYDAFVKNFPNEDISSIKDAIFNPEFDPVVTNLTPTDPTKDVITASANNIYDKEVTLAEVEKMPTQWRTKLNVRFAKKEGKVIPEVYKIGGIYSQELSNVVYFLKKALPLTEGLQKTAIENLIGYYETGDEELFRKASIDWLRARPRIDMIHGFIESYMDPRQTVGSFEGISYYTAHDPVLQGFSENVQYFEDRMPWDEKYKRKNITSKPVATLINVAVAVGEGGPITWSGINLPNYQDIRAKYGSKNVVLVNMIEARSKVNQDLLIKEFFLPEYQPLMQRYYGLARKMLLYMHEVIGHGSGAADVKLKRDPRDYIGKNYGAWEEARASLVAWANIADSKLFEIGAFAKEEQSHVIQALALLELQGQLVELRNSKGEEVLREAHDRADQMIFEYLRQNTDGFEVINKNEKLFVNIKNIDALLKGAKDLLKIVHEAKATGDKKTVDAYLEKYGNHFNIEWRDNVLARSEKVGLPELTAMVFPRLVPVVKEGEIVDVQLRNDETLESQHRHLSEISKMTELK